MRDLENRLDKLEKQKGVDMEPITISRIIIDDDGNELYTIQRWPPVESDQSQPGNR